MTPYSEAVTEYLKNSDAFENMLLAPEVDFEVVQETSRLQELLYYRLSEDEKDVVAIHYENLVLNAQH